MTDELDFDDLVEIEVPIKVKGKDYILREASSQAACAYRNAMIRCTTLGPDGRATRMDNIADTEPLLVSLCLFQTDGKPVDLGTIRSWPTRVVTALYDKAKEISSLNEVPTEKELLLEALVLPTSPCTIQELRDFIKDLNPDKYAPLQKWIKPTPEEEAKNLLKQTEAGSS